MILNCGFAALMVVLTCNDQVHGGQIIGGHAVKPHSKPFMVLVEKKSENKPEYCGGFLLSEDFVMTAAHCQTRLSYQSYQVYLGSHQYNDYSQKIEVEKEFPHDNFTYEGLENDIMLLKLSQKARFTDKVKPISLANSSDPMPKSCLVLGWGRTRVDSNEMSSKLMEVNVTLIDNEDCLKENAYCSEGLSGPYEGDSGGPLVCEDGIVYGVVSGSFPLKYTFLFRYEPIPDKRKWIDSVMKPK